MCDIGKVSILCLCASFEVFCGCEECMGEVVRTMGVEGRKEGRKEGR